MIKFMLDSNIFDAVIAEADMADRLNALSEKGGLTLLTTHIQEDELAKIPDLKKRSAISKIRRTRVTTAGAVLDVSKLDMCTLGDGSESGCGIGDIQSPSRNHVHDALIATTASRDVDVLVTQDQRFRSRIEQSKAKCQVWDFKQFKAYVYQEGINPQHKSTNPMPDKGFDPFNPFTPSSSTSQQESTNENGNQLQPELIETVTVRRQLGSIILGICYGGSLINGFDRGLDFVLKEEYVSVQLPWVEAAVQVLSGTLAAFLAAYSARSTVYGIAAGGIVSAIILSLNPLILDEQISLVRWFAAALVIVTSLPAAFYGTKLPLEVGDTRYGRLFGVSWKHWLWLWFPWQLMIANAVWVAYPASLQLGIPPGLGIVWELFKAPVSIVLVGYGVVNALESIREDAPYTRIQALGRFLFWFLIFPILVNLLRFI